MNAILIHWVAGVAAIVVVAMVIFQILLVAGLPLGHGAFGGENQILSRKLRFLSAMAVVVFLAALYIILARGGILGKGSESSSLARVGIWVLAIIFCVSSIANFRSVVVFLAALYIILARGGILGKGSESSSLARVGIWVLAIIFCVSTLANFSSHSRVERRLMAPIALLLTVCCVIMALA